MKHLPMMTSFVLFIALCASLAYWAMQIFKPKVRDVAVPSLTIATVLTLDAAAGLFGGRLNTPVASNYQLIGVIFASDPDESVAILATDGKPAQAIRNHRKVAPGVTLNEVNRHHVLLSEGGVIRRIELPEKFKVLIK